MKVCPLFEKRMKQLQGKIKAVDGREPSMTKLSEQIAKSSSWEEVEKSILKKDKILNVRFD